MSPPEPARDLPGRLLRSLRARAGAVRERTLIQYVRLGPWLAAGRGRARLRWLDADALRATRRAETAFVFGCGASLNELTPAEWEHIAAGQTIGFNYFTRQRFVRADYHVVGEIASGDDLDRRRWVPAVEEYARLIAENPCCRDTVLLLQDGWSAHQSNRLLAAGQLPAGQRAFAYRRTGRGVYRPPNRALEQGLVHGAGSLCGVVNFAFAMGFRRIVLAGVDLYDSRYFWLPPEVAREDLVEFHGQTQADPHPVARNIVAYLGRWAQWLRGEGVELSVYNPRSLLAGPLPVYRP